MGTMARLGRLIALACGTVLVLAGCGPSTEGAATTEASTAPSFAPDVPSGFDPCTDIPKSVLDSEGLRNKVPDRSQLAGAKWRGCSWGQPDGYSAIIRTTNVTLEMLRDKNFPGTDEFSIAGRVALSTRQAEEHPEESCYLNIEMNGGSLEFSLSNPASGDKTGHLDTCDLARTLAEKVAPLIPADA